MNTKENEKKYISKLNKNEKKWLIQKPFGNLPESSDRIRDFSHIIAILHLRKGDKILDLGVGSGWTSIFLAKMGYEVTGVDIAPDMIDIARKNAKKDNVDVNFLVFDNEKMLFDKKFDAILCYDTLHHCPNEEQVIKNCYKALKKEGKLLIVEPNFYHQIDKKAQKIAHRFNVLEKGFSPYYLKKILKRNNFSNIKRYYAHALATRAYDNSFVGTFKHLFSPFASRFIFGHYKSQLWILAQKK